MTHAIATLADRMLSRLVPALRAEAAGCPDAPYTYIQDCGCGNGHRYGRLCKVYSNCHVSCGSCYAYDYCM
jgi:hypothetical protein